MQWLALVTILLSPAWSDRLVPSKDIARPQRSISSVRGDDAKISSAVLPIPEIEDSEKRIFVEARQVRFEWRKILQRNPASHAYNTPVLLERRERDSERVLEEIALIPGEGEGLVLSTFVELREGVNFFRATFKDKKGQKTPNDFLVILKSQH